ncbi:MAG TPA: MBL fold metallo-hydrolase [Candidatus Kapabacteria bacterium]|nr:MBL fold metallo-hydrolase [Candidatus Kapabacteria bacterium]
MATMTSPGVDNNHSSTIQRIKEIEREIPRTIVRVEKKIVKFPFQRYFLGHQKPEDPKFKPDWKTWPNDTLALAWLGQSTVLINFYGTWIITDPVFSERVGIPLGPLTVGPRRMVHAPLQPEELPPIDLILISHAHMDHTDLPSLRLMMSVGRNGISPQPQIIIASNTKDIYADLKFQKIRELDWGERNTISPHTDLQVEAIEVRHAGWRMPWQPCRARNEKNGMSYNGYLVEKRDEHGELHAFVFGGDTGYIKSFHAIGERMRLEGREIECAIMPIGTYNPWVQTHCNPEQAWRMTQEMNARYIVPIHWNTYMQSSEPRYEPMEWLRRVVDEPRAIALTEHGETWNSG